MDSETEYAVVQNHEEQYSIWPTFKNVPKGWQEVGTRGTKQECLDYIESVWLDITPKSVRESIRKQRTSELN
ncbi:MAG TPA: MbtH family protein [Steroidobacteraceae bacterium]|nr:MbtH family protein [Steroidobacteraceae bacterium]